eukprot:m.2758 g.2758  ORF g.2758 m.2758 type:complete len:66 (+) comp4027_c0_seq1:41-238(+)
MCIVLKQSMRGFGICKRLNTLLRSLAGSHSQRRTTYWLSMKPGHGVSPNTLNHDPNANLIQSEGC